MTREILWRFVCNVFNTDVFLQKYDSLYFGISPYITCAKQPCFQKYPSDIERSISTLHQTGYKINASIRSVVSDLAPPL